MDKLVLLLLVARDEDDDVVDEVPPTGWPRDKPALVYSGWDEPNGLWTEDINTNVQHQVIQCLQQFLFNTPRLELQKSHQTQAITEVLYYSLNGQFLNLLTYSGIVREKQ